MYSPTHPFFKLYPGATVKSNKSMSCRTWLRLSVAKFSSHIQSPLTRESNKVPVSPGQCQVLDNDFMRIKWLLSYYTPLSSITWTWYLSKTQSFLLLDFAGEKRNGIENTVSESLKLKLLMEFNPILSSELWWWHTVAAALSNESHVHQWSINGSIKFRLHVRIWYLRNNHHHRGWLADWRFWRWKIHLFFWC